MAPEYVSPFTWKGIKKNPGVLPVVFCIALGTAMAIGYTARLALYCPDVTWNSRRKREPWNDYENKEYKFYQSEPFDVKNYQHPRPRF